MSSKVSAAVLDVPVALGERSYRVKVGTGTMTSVGADVAEVLPAGLVHVVTNPTVGALYFESLAQGLRAVGFEPHRIEILDGEEHKNIQSLDRIYTAVLERGAERGSPMLALGGGVVGDLTGFAAATVLRGVPYVQVPTTLLAQVDSSVGGKTAINHRVGKNLIGAFYQPRLVVIDTATLTSLPRRELLAGLAEVIKYGVIVDPALFQLIEDRLDQFLSLDAELVREVVARCCAIKADVVAKDEREHDLRAILNYGHTVGHGIEAVTQYRRYLHGEAVAIGMVAAARLSARLGLCDAAIGERLSRLLERAGLPSEVPGDIDLVELVGAIARDKKASKGKIKFICSERLGATCFQSLAAAEVVELLSRDRRP